MSYSFDKAITIYLFLYSVIHSFHTKSAMEKFRYSPKTYQWEFFSNDEDTFLHKSFLILYKSAITKLVKLW